MNSHVKVKILVAEYRLPILLLFAGIIWIILYYNTASTLQNNSNDNIEYSLCCYGLLSANQPITSILFVSSWYCFANQMRKCRGLHHLGRFHCHWQRKIWDTPLRPSLWPYLEYYKSNERTVSRSMDIQHTLDVSWDLNRSKSFVITDNWHDYSTDVIPHQE